MRAGPVFAALAAASLLTAGLLGVARLQVPPPPVAETPRIAPMAAGLDAELQRGQALRQQLLHWRDDLARRLSTCRPPTPPPAAVVETAPSPPPAAALAPPPPAPVARLAPLQPLRLPAALDCGQDLSFLRGCWLSDAFRHRPRQPAPGRSEYCFDALGQGRLVYRAEGRSCRAAARAEAVCGGTLDLVDQDSSCSDGSPWFADRVTCRRGADGVALCGGEASDPELGRVAWSLRLYRRDAMP